MGGKEEGEIRYRQYLRTVCECEVFVYSAVLSQNRPPHLSLLSINLRHAQINKSKAYCRNIGKEHKRHASSFSSSFRNSFRSLPLFLFCLHVLGNTHS